MKKQTAVEWLERRYYFTKGQLIDIDFEQAKAMEREQIIESYCVGCADITKDNSIFPRETSEQYYNETYKEGEQ